MEHGHLTMEDLYFIRVDRGEDVAATVQKAVTELGIPQGVFLCGIGVMSRANLYSVISTTYPAQRHYDVVEQPVEVTAIQGNIIQGQVHMHTIVSTAERCYAGHLDAGNIALIPLQIILARLGGDKIVRKPNPGPEPRPALITFEKA